MVRSEAANTDLIAHVILGTMVDAVIMAMAPHAAVISGKYDHTGVPICHRKAELRIN